MASVRNEKIKRLEEFLSSLNIRISKTSDGTFTASTTIEPLFCFSRPTVEELAHVIADTLTSYVINFWDGYSVDIDIEQIREEAAPPPRQTIPIEALVPYSRARPIVRRSPRRELEPA